MHEVADFRSDKVALPTPEMLQAMTRPIWGDGITDEGPSVRKLERLACELTGKPDALFVISGTMANELAVKAHTQPGDQIVLDDQSHIFAVESGYAAAISGVQTCTLPSHAGVMDLADVEGTLKARFARTTLLCTENTHNLLGGTVVPIDHVKELYALAHKHGAAVHLDGARILNASVKSGIPVADYTNCADSVMFCLSKGLCAPAGSMLCGSKEFVRRANAFRQTVGGMLKQPGPLAECGIIALTQMAGRLHEDHENATSLAHGLNALPEADRHFALEQPQTNMVFFTLKSIDGGVFLERCAKRGVLALHMGAGRVRCVTHNDIDAADVNRAVQVIAEILHAQHGS